MKTTDRFRSLKLTRINMGMFDFEVKVIFYPSRKLVAEYAAWSFESPKMYDDFDFEEFDARGTLFRKNGYTPILWMPKKPKTPREMATLAHEAFHAIVEFAAWSSLVLSRETEEIFCHAVGHIVNGALTQKHQYIFKR